MTMTGATAAAEMERRWDEFLEEASFRMSRATFDTWLRSSRLLAHDDEALVVGVAHAAAAEWIEKRMLPGLREPLGRHFPGLEIQVRPLSSNGNGSGPDPAPAGTGETAAAARRAPSGDLQDEPSPGPASRPRENRAGKAPSGKPRAGHKTVEAAGETGEPEEEDDDEAIECDSVTDPALARFDVSTAGWSKLANYALYFWSRLLGPAAFLTWQAIRHEDIRRNKTEWTPIMTFSVNDLADMAAAGNPQAITGVWRTCRASSMTERGEPCPQCAGRGGQIQAPHVCRYWRPGALDRLQAEGVAVVERRGEGRHTTYRVRVFTLLPLLTPSQVADLRPGAQQRHSRWLLKQNLDPAGWERLTVRHLALPPLEGDL